MLASCRNPGRALDALEARSQDVAANPGRPVARWIRFRFDAPNRLGDQDAAGVGQEGQQRGGVLCLRRNQRSVLVGSKRLEPIAKRRCVAVAMHAMHRGFVSGSRTEWRLPQVRGERTVQGRRIRSAENRGVGTGEGTDFPGCTVALCFVFGRGLLVLNSPGDFPEEAFPRDLPSCRACDWAVLVFPASLLPDPVN